MLPVEARRGDAGGFVRTSALSCALRGGLWCTAATFAASRVVGLHVCLPALHRHIECVTGAKCCVQRCKLAFGRRNKRSA